MVGSGTLSVNNALSNNGTITIGGDGMSTRLNINASEYSDVFTVYSLIEMANSFRINQDDWQVLIDEDNIWYKVWIWTNSPTEELDVNWNGKFNGSVQIWNSNTCSDYSDSGKLRFHSYCACPAMHMHETLDVCMNTLGIYDRESIKDTDTYDGGLLMCSCL